MSRRSDRAAESAAAQASEAARVLQARGQETRSEPRAEPSPEPAAPPKDKAEVRQVTARNEPRRLAMEEIEARDLETKGLKPELPEKPVLDGSGPGEDSKVAPTSLKEMLDKPADVVSPVPTETGARSLAEALDTVRIKVDGEEFDVPKVDVDAEGGIGPYQRRRAEENRIKKANEILVEARRTQAAIEEWKKQQAPAKPAEQPIDQFVQSKLDEIRFGTPEQGTAAFLEAVKRATPQGLDPNEIVQLAVLRIENKAAVETFRREFSEIAANPLLWKLAVTLEKEKIGKVNGPIDWNSFYRTIGNEVRSALGRPSQSATPTPATGGNPSQPPSDKEARKASIVNLPVAAARAQLPQEEKPGTPEEERRAAINAMKKARGIPTG